MFWGSESLKKITDMNISSKIKSALLGAILKEENAFGMTDDNGILDFLNEIWDLKNMPSEDDRFENAYGDVSQHTVNNDDWELEYLFVERLKLFDNDEIFIKFLETIVSPKYRPNEDEIIRFVLLINQYLEKEKLSLYVKEYNDDGDAVYVISKIDDNNFFSDLPVNKIPFYIFQDKLNNDTPCFVLLKDNWNDYNYYTSFCLSYHSGDDIINIGYVKIGHLESKDTRKVIPTTFTLLDGSFCSLGQDYDYYLTLKNKFGRNFLSILYALKDCSFFEDVHDKFQREPVFYKSLLRKDAAEQLLRVVKHKIFGYDLNNLFSFKYNFTPKYATDSVDIEFNFSEEGYSPNRIYGIIGKNGVGKTQLITSLPINISRKEEEFFIPNSPMFSKVIAVSYSVFDNFEIPKKTSLFNYVYCGLLDDNGEFLSIKKQGLRFHRTWKKIKELGRMGRWRNILIHFIEEEIVNEFVLESDEWQDEYTVDVKGFNNIKSKLSSGQGMMLYIISEIVSHIRFDSLLLFDEPETHLHPNAITQLMNTIYELVKEFKSYCIIVTHSPLIIQELFAKNVYVMEKHDKLPSLRKIGIESFGENLTVLTEEVFGNKEIEKQYKKIIDELVDLGKNYQQIIDDIETNDLPLSLNARLYIKSKVKK